MEEGYLYQTEDKYSVLKMGDIEPLKDEHTKVILKTYEQKETSKKKKVKKQRSTGALTSLGSELFEELRKLRLEIARAESLPPYIVFNDKTLIDMCLKQPKTPGEFLDVSGVGQSKLEKYGDRFLDVIKSFTETHSEEISKGMDFATEEIDFTK